MKRILMLFMICLAVLVMNSTSYAELCCKKLTCKLCVVELRVIKLCNIEREKRGIAPVKRLKALVDNCRQHSAEQCKRKQMFHGNLKGASCENVAVGQETADQVVRAWMNSSGHRANILNRRWKFIGYGKCQKYHTMQCK